ncbi:MAG: ABC transporter ATP-binding protein [Acidobacteriota bacterium]
MTSEDASRQSGGDDPPGTTSPAPVLELSGLKRHHPSGEGVVAAVDGVDLSISPGEFLAILGPSGSGKSTLLGLMGGLDRPTDGDVRHRGRSLVGLDEDALARWRRAELGFVFQSHELLPRFTALENVELPLDLAGIEDARERALRWLEAVGLGARAHHLPSQLSGGEQQRVAVARAFANEPGLLLADEPTGNLDRESGGRVLDLLDDLRRRRETAMVIVTHDSEVAARADRSIHLRDGRIEREVVRAETTTCA